MSTTPNPYTSPDVREDIRVEVVGVHWGAYIEQGSLARQERPTACYVYSIPYDYFAHLEGGAITRDEVDQWLSTHSGDFEEIWDFSVSDLDLAWQSEDSEVMFNDHWQD